MNNHPIFASSFFSGLFFDERIEGKRKSEIDRIAFFVHGLLLKKYGQINSILIAFLYRRGPGNIALQDTMPGPLTGLVYPPVLLRKEREDDRFIIQVSMSQLW